MGRFGFSVSAVLAMCLFGGYAAAQNENSTSQEVHVLQMQAEDASQAAQPDGVWDSSQTNSGQTSEQQSAHAPDPVWFYGAFLDSAYLLDFNHPANDLFRSRGTAYKVDYPLINMAGAYIRKTPSESSRWGMELTTQAGQDTRVFGFSATAPNLPGYEGLRHLGPTDVSYLAPVGKGLTIQGESFQASSDTTPCTRKTISITRGLGGRISRPI